MRRGSRFRGTSARVLLLALLLGAVSCAYYNTFFLARKSFRAAEDTVLRSPSDKAPVDALRNYDSAIRQSKKVLLRHSGSRWVDDAIYLMGASYYGKGEYDSALTTFSELDRLFPKSPYGQDAIFLSGMCRTKLREYAEAAKLFETLEREHPGYPRRDEILYTLAQTAETRRDSRAAIDRYQDLVAQFPKSRFLPGAYSRIGQLHFDAGRYDSAGIAFERLVLASKDQKVRIDAAIQQAQALIKLDRSEEALKLLRSMEPPETAAYEADRLQTAQQTQAQFQGDKGAQTGSQSQGGTPPEEQRTNQYTGYTGAGQQGNQYEQEQTYRQQQSLNTGQTPAGARTSLTDDIARLRLQEAAALNKMGKSREALATLRGVTEIHATSSFAVEAQFQIGYTYETLLDSLKVARAAYDKAAQMSGRSIFKDQAVARSKALQSQLDLSVKTSSTDAAVEERAGAALRIAEILLLDRDLSTDAMKQYRIIESQFPETRSAPKAAYALAFIRWKKQGDSLGAQQEFRDLVGRYPSSTQARGAINLLARQGADTSGLASLLREMAPDTTAAAADTLRSAVDPLTVRPDSMTVLEDTTRVWGDDPEVVRRSMNRLGEHRRPGEGDSADARTGHGPWDSRRPRPGGVPEGPPTPENPANPDSGNPDAEHRTP